MGKNTALFRWLLLAPLAVLFFATSPAYAFNPYVVDASTLHLFHLEDATDAASSLVFASHGNPVYTPGLFNNALTFNGSSTYLDSAFSTSTTPTKISLVVHFKLQTVDDNFQELIFQRRDAPLSISCVQEIGTYQHGIYFNSQSLLTATSSGLTAGVWHKAVLNYDTDGNTSSSVEFWYDGVKIGSVYSTPQCTAAGGALPNQLALGANLYLTPNGFAENNVQLDEVVILKGAWYTGEPPAKEPVVIVPGIMGTTLNRVASPYDEVWPDDITNNTALDDLQLSTGGVQISGKEMNASSVIESAFDNTFYGNLVGLGGYTKNVNLFTVPYDWRMDIPNQINKLDSIVSRAIASSTNGKINIIAHSMGGLLVRDYLATTSSAQFLDKLILLGTPELGAPRAAELLNYGDDFGLRRKILFGLFNVGLDPAEAKKISQNMPAVYELLPSRNYFSTVGSYLAEFGFGQPNNFVGYDTTKQFLINQGRNEGLLALADAYHVRDTNPINASKIYNIVGCNNYNTIGGFLIYPTSTGRVDLGYVSGDGTVPLGSANSISSTTLTYYAPFDTTGIDHLGLVKSSDTLNVVQNILNNTPLFSSGNVSQDATPCTQGSPNAIIFQTHSPVSLSVYDSQNRHLGPTASSTVEFGIPGADYNIIEHNSFARVPAGDTYRVILNGTASGTAEFDIESATGATITNKAVYQNIPIASNQTVASTTFSSFQGNLTLNLDSNGNGVSVVAIQPSAVLSGTQSADITPPTITMPNIASTTIVGTPLTFSFSATDDLSGVATTTATIDGNPIANGATVSNLAVGAHTLQVKAVDNAGNPNIQSLTFNVIYSFGGFLPPIKADGSGLYNLGRTLPVKFQLTNASGSFVTNAAAQLFVANVSNNVIGTNQIALSTGNADTGNTFRYDSTSNQYVFNFDTTPLTTGTWQLKATLNDGTNYVVLISLH